MSNKKIPSSKFIFLFTSLVLLLTLVPYSLLSQSTDELRIGIRTAEGIAEFFDKLTGATFVPRGNN